ncbi:oligopeptide transporter, OPT family [Methylobacterium sp. NEAU 140]|uniref:OPT family oligopeptide transporter n=1 Tax=Methylobacterium sp. NEAU 140 TaxID=3064945 RepID=UPI0027330D20|nr:oligopeptide transporter, OPT family [Methylobacterium sp. NEAU 140]MDP4023725.1 oligopeptide transporter, OPT family [Methylobacterium sp. NEAU 140]
MPSAPGPAELTLRAVALGGAITLLFTAANVYLGLKVGLTFATSIPAAVISMAVLRRLPGATVLENNIVQTIASAAGTLAAIIFVLPGLVMIGWWHGFPWLTTAGITATGGILGVMFSVPLRRALVVDTDLPYPEGHAAAEVLALGSGSRAGEADSARGLRILVWNGLASAGFAALAQTRIVLDSAALWFRVGGGATGISGNLSFALLGVGHLVGPSVGAAMALGLAIAWAGLVPLLSAAQPRPELGAEAWAGAVFSGDVRFFGAGVIGVAALWTLGRIAGPVLGGIRSALAAGRARRAGAALAVEERDLPLGAVVGVSLAMLAPIAWLLWSVIAGTGLERHGVALVIGALLFVLVIGLIVAAVTGYMAGLIGSSNSPVSGIGILSVLASAALLVGLFGRGVEAGTAQALVAYALIVTGIVFGVATIANDNMQDLKTGQLVGATPWKQQAALVIGVLFGSAIVPPVLDVLGSGLGFVGAPGAGPNALAAPQAGLISALARGVVSGEANWRMLGWGAGAALALIALDETLGRLGRLRLPPLGVALGIYLPMKAVLPVVAGALVGTLYARWARRRADPERALRMGTLTATGLIVGESLWGVAFAVIVYLTGSDAPLALAGDGVRGPALIGGLVLFAGLAAALYGAARRAAA